MKVAVNSGNVTIEAEGKDQRDVFEQLASLQEVFGERNCGACGETRLRFRVREDKEENKYYEMVCEKCSARLVYGCHKKGNSLFPKRKIHNAQGEEVFDTRQKGWSTWKPKANEQDKEVTF